MVNSTTDYLWFKNECRHCECCRPEMVSMTCSSGEPFKWSKEEIVREIIQTASRLSKMRWYEPKGEIKARLKHWTEKLARFEEAKKEFKI